MYSLAIMRAERVHVAVKFADGSMTPADVEKHFMQNVPWMEPHVAKKHEVWRKYVDFAISSATSVCGVELLRRFEHAVPIAGRRAARIFVTRVASVVDTPHAAM